VYCRGSFQSLADGFVTAIRENGGDVIFGRRVTRIELDDGRVAGVELEDGRRLRAGIVVSNADARQTYEEMVGAEHLPRPLTRQLGRLTPSLSGFVLLAATTLDVSAAGLPHEMFIYPEWDHDRIYRGVQDGRPGGLWITFPTTFDRGLAPEGQHLVILSSIAPYDIAGGWDEARPAWDELLLDEIESLLPGFRREVVFTTSVTPPALERYTSNHRGAIYGWEATPGQSTGKRLRQASPIEGLFLAGHWTEPGAGSFRAIYSGMTAALLAMGFEALPQFLDALEARGGGS
jgi:prolycopene isomerase